MKNLIGAIGDDSRDPLHYQANAPARLSRDIVLLNQAFSPLMNIVDTQTALINGGQEGVLADAVYHDIGAVLASTNRVALDLVGAALIQLGLEDTPVPRPDPVHETLVTTSAWDLPQITEGRALGIGLAPDSGDRVHLLAEGFERQERLESLLATRDWRLGPHQRTRVRALPARVQETDPMDDVAALIEKLERIEALHAGAATEGERIAAAEARRRIRARLDAIATEDPPVEIRFAIHNPWSRRLFTALLRRYDLKPYRYPRQRRQTIMVKMPESAADELFQEFTDLDRALCAHLDQFATTIISRAIATDTSEAAEVREIR